jgi:ribose 5-phosphate isomerase A
MMVVITDKSKQVDHLGAFPLPVEVIPFGWQTTKALIEESLIGMDVAGRSVTLRLNRDASYRTDEGNLILDLHLRRIGNPRQLALVLNQIPGVVENGLFLDICDVVIMGDADGGVEVRDINNGTVTYEKVDIQDDDNIFVAIAD